MKSLLVLVLIGLHFCSTPLFGEEKVLNEKEQKVRMMLKSLDAIVLEALVDGRSATEENLRYVKEEITSALEAVRAHVSMLTTQLGAALPEKEREIYLKRMQIFQQMLEDEQKRLKDQ